MKAPKELINEIDAGKHFYRDTIAVGKRVLVFEKHADHVRHSLYIQNLSTTDDVRLKTADSDSAPYITLKKNSEKTFEPHQIAAIQWDENTILFLSHCEWTEDLYVEVPSTASGSVTIEAFEIF